MKTDFALFYLDLWDAIWKHALEDCRITEPCTIDEMIKEEDCSPSLKMLWEEGLCRAHYHPNKEDIYIYTYVTAGIVNKKVAISIRLSSWDGDGNPQKIPLSSAWQSLNTKKFYGWYNTAFPAIDPATIKEIDCTQMQQAAEQALCQLMGG